MPENAPAAAAGRTLEELAVTDLVYQALESTANLTQSVCQAVCAAVPAPASLLLVGPNVHLVATLHSLGYEIEVWRLADQLYEAKLPVPVTGTFTGDDLAGLVGREFDAIVLTLALERQTAPVATLEALLGHIRPGGPIVMAVEHAGRLETRVAALRGQRSPLGPAESGENSHGSRLVSWNWSAAPVRWTLSGTQWRELLGRVGLDVTHAAFVLGRNAALPAMPMGVIPYVGSQVKHAVKRCVPSVRDFIVLTAQPRPVPLVAPEPAWAGAPLDQLPSEDWPKIAVVVQELNREGSPQPLRTALATQTYPRDRLTLLPPIAAGTAELLAGTDADLFAFLPVIARPAPYWAEGAVTAMVFGAHVVVGALAPSDPSAPSLTPGVRRTTNNGQYAWGNVLCRRSVLESLALGSPSIGGNLGEAVVAAAQRTGVPVVFSAETLVHLDAGVTTAALRQRWERLTGREPSVNNGPADRPAARPAFWLALTGTVLAATRRRWEFGLLAAPWLVAHCTAAAAPQGVASVTSPRFWRRLLLMIAGNSLDTILFIATIGGKRRMGDDHR